MNKQDVYNDIKKRISSKELAPGQWVIERDICDTYGISRTPVREILLKLSGEGLLVSEAGKGYKVKSLTFEELVSIYQARSAVEGYATQLLCQNLTPGIKAIFQGIYDDLNKVDVKKDISGALALGRKLHLSIVENTDNFLIKEFSEKINNYMLLTANLTENWLKIEHNSKEGHLRILEAILDEDGERAAKMMKAHLHETIQLTLRSYISKSTGLI